MDRRKIIVEKGKSFHESLNSDDLNLEIANNLENLFELRDIIKMKARQSFDEKKDKTKFLSFMKGAQSLESNPKFAYSSTVILWWILYQGKKVSKVSLLYALLGISIFYNIRRHFYCKLQKEYKDYQKLNETYHQIIKLKKKSLNLENFLMKILGVKFDMFSEEDKFKLIKYEFIF